MEKFSVRKPFTVLVAVIAVIALGVVSAMNMSMDLLPDISIPYLMVITTYPGASPEKVELEVSEPLENVLGTISHIENVYSVSSENFSMVQLEFEDDTDMDSAMVKVSSAVEQARSSLPANCAAPTIMELSMDMLASMYIAVERDGYDIYELSEYVRDEFQPAIERVNGVASVTTIGLVTKTVQVDLNGRKIDELNAKILQETTKQLDDAEQQLNDAKAQVDEGQAALEAKENNIQVWLAPGVNIHRNPLCGRNFEYYSEDPLLAGRQAASLIKGVQSQGVAATPKHFALNNKETNRVNSDSRASERAIREIYLRQFEILVKEARPWSIMTSYNIINGHRASENRDLLTGILREEWGFDGMVTTDWWTKGEHYKETAAGNDMKMATGFPDRLLAAKEKGALTREDMEKAARNVLGLILRVE